MFQPYSTAVLGAIGKKPDRRVLEFAYEPDEPEHHYTTDWVTCPSVSRSPRVTVRVRVRPP